MLYTELVKAMKKPLRYLGGPREVGELYWRSFHVNHPSLGGFGKRGLSKVGTVNARIGFR